MNPYRCPVCTTDFENIRRYLEELPLDELIFLTEEIYGTLGSGEKISYDINRYCSGYTDIQGRINFIRSLLENAVIASIHIPYSYRRDPRLIELIRPSVYEYFIPVAKEMREDGAALTDELEQSTAESITVSNPRWEHADETRKEESPTVARVGDKVTLFVDVSGYPDGASVTFDIFDSSGDPAMRIETERGKNEGGTAKIEWVVCDPNGQGEALKLEFEGSARSKSSGKAPIDIKLEGIYRIELKDEEGNPLEGIKVEFAVPGEEPVEVETDANGIAEHPAKDPSVEADVRILWEEAADGETDDVAGTPDEQVTVAEETSSKITAEKGFEVLLVDEEDKPLAGVKIQFETGTETKTIETDSDGRAFFNDDGACADATVKVQILQEL